MEQFNEKGLRHLQISHDDARNIPPAYSKTTFYSIKFVFKHVLPTAVLNKTCNELNHLFIKNEKIEPLPVSFGKPVSICCGFCCCYRRFMCTFSLLIMIVLAGCDYVCKL